MTFATSTSLPARRRLNVTLPRVGRDEIYALATVSFLLGGVVGGRAALFAVMAGLVLAMDFRRVVESLPVLANPVFLPLVLFLLVYLVSGLTVSSEVFFSLSLQVLIVAAFAIPFYVRYSRVPMARFNRAFGTLVVLITALLVGWHVANGYLTGWKRLGETKGVLSLLPIALLAFLSAHRRPWIQASALVLATCLIVLLSGERKAYQALAVALLLAANFRNPTTWLAGLIVVLFVPLAAALDPTGYVQTQIDSVLAFGRGEVVVTLSNRMREWQLHYVLQLFSEHPVFGIGTHSYEEISLQQFRSSTIDYVVPGLGIHGEGLRVLTENGVVGIIVWGALVLTSLVAAVWPNRDGRRRSWRERKIALAICTAVLLYVAFEAFDTTMMLIYFVLPMLGALRISGDAQLQRPEGLLPVRRAASRAGQSGLVQGRSIST